MAIVTYAFKSLPLWNLVLKRDDRKGNEFVLIMLTWLQVIVIIF